MMKVISMMAMIKTEILAPYVSMMSSTYWPPCRVKAATANVPAQLLLGHLGDAGQAQKEANEYEGCSNDHFLASGVKELFENGNF